MSTKDESKLPKWAQSKLEDLRQEITRLDALRKAHALLNEHEWFTVLGHEGSAPFKLFVLNKDSAHPVCSIGVGDVLLVGRKKYVPGSGLDDGPPNSIIRHRK